MANDNIDDWQEVPTSPGTAAQSGMSVSQDPNDPGDWQEVSRIPTDPITGEQLPVAFSGLSPETAMNKSVVSAIDRLKLSAGNTEGNVAYLKTKFQDVRPIKDADGNDTSEVAVQKDGSWYRVDPSNGEIADPWEKTKEYMMDVVDAAPIVAGVAAGAAATYFSGGTAAPAAPAVAAGTAAATASAGVALAGAVGAGTALVRTSLGRLVGTYEATPLEQVYDIGLESLINMAGAKIAPAVKPTAAWMANKIDDLVTVFGDTLPGKAAQGAGQWAGESSKAMMKQVFAGFSVGVDNFDTMLENPNAVKAVMKNTYATVGKGGKNSAAYHDSITAMQRQAIANFADNARSTLSKIYGQASNKILSKISPDFTANFDEPLIASYRDALSKGLGQIDMGDGTVLRGAEAVKWLGENGLTAMKGYAPKVFPKGAGKGIPGEVGDIIMDKVSTKIPKFSLLSQGEMKEVVRMGGELADDLGYLATNKEAHAAVSSFYDDLGGFARSLKSKGPEAAKNLLNFKKVASNKAYDLANQDHVARMPGVKRLLDNARASVDDNIYQTLKKAGAGNEFQELNSLYSNLQREMSPILKVREQAIRSGDMQPYETMLSRFLARPGKNATSKFAIDASIEAAQVHGLKDLAAELAAQKTSIQVGQAAKAFNPLQTGFSKGENASKAMFAAGALISGNPIFLGMAATGVALRSTTTPRLAAAATQGLWKGQEMLSSIPAKEMGKFLADPKVTMPFLQGVTAAPLIYEKTRQALTGQIEQVMSQGQGQ